MAKIARPSDVKALYQSYKQYMKSLEEKNEEFVLNILHDIKSPIAGINIALENLPDEIKNETLREIYRVNLHNLEYIENLMENYSMKTGKYLLKYEYFNIINIINEEIFALRFLIIEKSLKINLICNAECININADKQIIRQAFLNLLTNAVKYSPHGEEVKIEVSKNKKNVSVCVTNKTSGNERGTGLGEGIIKEALSMLRGKISHTKNKNKICVYIEIPRE